MVNWKRCGLWWKHPQRSTEKTSQRTKHKIEEQGGCPLRMAALFASARDLTKMEYLLCFFATNLKKTVDEYG